MKWQEIRTHYPQQWLLVEAIQARSVANERILEQLAVIGTFSTVTAAISSRQQLQRLAPGRELYVFHTSQERLDVAVESTESQSVGKRDIDKPTKVEIASNRDRVKISWKHFGYEAQFFAVLWIIALLAAIGGGAEGRNSLYTCRAPLVILTLVMLYYLLIWLNNAIVVQVDRTTLKTSREGPIPCFHQGQTIPSADIRQVYIKYWVRQGRYGVTSYYDIYVLTTYGHHGKFMTVDKGKLALYLEQEIERFLGIEDQVMRGEWRPEPYLWES